MLKLERDDGIFNVGATFPTENPHRVFLPTLVVFPYTLTDEKPECSPLTLKLDSVGTRLLDRPVHLLVGK